MADLTPEIVDDVVAACTAGVDEAGEALGRALDAKIGVTVGEARKLDLGSVSKELSSPGLAVVLTVGSAGALLLLPESSGLLPDWYTAPDPTGQSKLTTLAQELGMILLPEEFMPDDFSAAHAKNLEGALRRAGVSDGASVVPLELASDNKQGTALLIWPASKPQAAVGAASKDPAAKPQETPAAAAAAMPGQTEKPGKPARRRSPARFRELPGYTRSLLQIKVPVIVNLARERQPLGRIVELGPGSIIQFDKSCEDMLEMNVANCLVASGEAVKVGDKFGLRITSIVMPEERFTPASPDKG